MPTTRFKSITFDRKKAREIASGGEGTIYEHPTDKNKVAKMYHQPRPATFAKHLMDLMIKDPEFVTPDEICFVDKTDQVAGFSMRYVNFNKYWLFNNLFNKGFCTANGIDKAFKITLLGKLRDAIERLHKKGVIVGDLNQFNIFVSGKGDLLFVDVDSFASKTWKHSGVLLDDIRDWTTQEINEQTDAWAYDILSFWATTYCHPFKWVVPGNKETLEQRVRNGKSILKPIPGVKIPPLYDPPDIDIKKQFTEIFGGRRYMVSFKGQYVSAPLVVMQNIASQSLTIRELFKNVKRVHACRTQVAVETDIWSLVETGTPKVTRVTHTGKYDQLFPSYNMFAYVKGNVLYDSKGKPRNFAQPEFYYNDGYLSVLDYATDMMWNMNINAQLSGIECTFTPTFAKSITIRDTPIQNFGGQKYLNIPVRAAYTMMQVPLGTKNAYYNRQWAAIEYKEKSKVLYMLKNALNKEEVDLDYLPYFTVNKDMILLPDNGHIAVLKDGAIITNLDCGMCTRDSKLYATDSGILLLENGNLYLLNTKS